MTDIAEITWAPDDPEAQAIVRALVAAEPDADMLLSMLGLDR